MLGLKPGLSSALVPGGYRASVGPRWREVSCVGAAEGRAEGASPLPTTRGGPAASAGRNGGFSLSFFMWEVCDHPEGLVGGRLGEDSAVLGAMGGDGALGQEKWKRWWKHPQLQTTGGDWDLQWSEEEEGGLGGSHRPAPQRMEPEEKEHRGWGRRERTSGRPWRWPMAPVPGCHQSPRGGEARAGMQRACGVPNPRSAGGVLAGGGDGGTQGRTDGQQHPRCPGPCSTPLITFQQLNWN